MTVRFGPFTLDAGKRQLLRGSVAIHLTPKAFDLLHLLVSEAPRVMSKRELHDQLWPDSFVSDASLSGLIKELRRALGVWPEDLGSKNGTSRGGEPVRSAVALSDGDRVAFASIVGVYHTSSAGISTETRTRSTTSAMPPGLTDRSRPWLGARLEG